MCLDVPRLCLSLVSCYLYSANAYVMFGERSIVLAGPDNVQSSSTMSLCVSSATTHLPISLVSRKQCMTLIPG